MAEDTFELKGKYVLDASGASTTLKKLEQQTKKTEEGFQKFADNSTIALAAFGVSLGVASHKLLGLGKAGANLDRLQVSTYVLGQNAGLTQKQIDGMVQSLEDTNTFGTNAWAAINTLTRAGLLPMMSSLERVNTVTGETEKSFDAFIFSIKDLAAAAGVSSSEAIRNVTTAIDQMNPAILQTLGVTGGLTTAFGDFAAQNQIVGRQLTNTEKKQAILNFVMKEAEKVTGTYSATYSTAGKNLLSLESAAQSTSEEIGQALQPAFRTLTGATLKSLKAFRDWTKENNKTVVGVVSFVAAAGTLIFTVGTLVKAIGIAKGALAAFRAMSLATQASLGALSVVVIGLSLAFSKAMMDTVKEQNKAEDATVDLGGALGNMGDVGSKALDQIKDKADETGNRLRDIQKQIADENRAFNKQLAEIIDRRRQNLANNKKSLAAEEREFKRKQEDMAKEYKKRTEELGKQNESRLKDLEESLAATLVVGSDTYSKDVENYEMALDEEREAHSKRLEEAKKEYEQETTEAKTQYDERTNALREKIKEDEAFLKKHAEIAKTINREILEDEIEELKRTHKERLKQLESQMQQEKSTYQDTFDDVGGSFGDMMDTMNAQRMDWDEILAPIDFNEVLRKTGQNVANFFVGIGGYLLIGMTELNYTIFETVRDLIEQIPVIGGELANKFENISFNKGLRERTTAFQNNVQGVMNSGIQFATGGFVTTPGVKIVGENGPEALEMPVGTRVVDASSTRARQDQMKTRGDVTVTNYNSFYYPEDQDVFNQKLAYQLRSLT